MGNVVVLGSLNYDCIARIEEFPRPGQTLAAAALDFKLGGKGANQAVAAARQGANVAMIGCVGDDGAGHSYIDYLRRRGILTGGIIVREEESTGTAMILVRKRDGENTIVVGAAANDLQLVITQDQTFYDTLRTKLGWGLRRRAASS